MHNNCYSNISYTCNSSVYLDLQPEIADLRNFKLPTYGAKYLAFVVQDIWLCSKEHTSV